jgi:hypothetical protein
VAVRAVFGNDCVTFANRGGEDPLVDEVGDFIEDGRLALRCLPLLVLLAELARDEAEGDRNVWLTITMTMRLRLCEGFGQRRKLDAPIV